MAKNMPLKVARARKDMTQKDLAEQIGVSRQTINAIEKGEYNPTIKLCLKICRALGTTLDELFWEDENMENGYELLTEKDAMWAEMLLQVLKDNAVACTALPVHGAGLTNRTGIPERLQIYVPKESIASARELMQCLFPSETN